EGTYGPPESATSLPCVSLTSPAPVGSMVIAGPLRPLATHTSEPSKTGEGAHIGLMPLHDHISLPVSGSYAIVGSPLATICVLPPTEFLTGPPSTVELGRRGTWQKMASGVAACALGLRGVRQRSRP